MVIIQYILAGIVFLLGMASLLFGVLPMAALTTKRGYGGFALACIALYAAGVALFTLIAFHIMPWLAASYAWIIGYF